MEMDTISIDDSTEREEGEIVDDDLEEISDTSITSTSWMGKFTSHKESLRALSLSSVSDLEVGDYTPTPRVKRKRVRKRSVSKKVSKNIFNTKDSSNSSDSDENVSVTKKLLREAIRIDKEEIHNNSLRTRLKGMVQDVIPTQNDTKSTNDVPDTIPSSTTSLVRDSPIELIENKESQDSQSSEEDTELIQLRLEALKTAVINKFEHRKKRKAGEKVESKNSEIDKENNSDPVNTPNNENIGNCSEENSLNQDAGGNSVNNSEEDEDEDILRAVLLASIAKKITTKVSTPNLKPQIDSVKNIPDKKLDQNLPKIPKSQQNSHPTVQSKPKPELNLPSIPRFIISVNNSDSNSEDEEKKLTTPKPTQQDLQKKVEDEVEKFLKQQRAVVEAKQQKTSNVPKINKFNPQTQLPKPNNTIPETNNLYKLLPKSKQLEYEKLIQRLKSAEKKSKLKKPSNKPSIFKSRTKILKKIQNNSASPSKTQLKGTLQRTLKDMQTQVNGRLQIKGRYHILTPLMKKLNEASQEQKKYEMSINALLTQLKEARSQFEKSQENFNNLLKEFLEKKDEIDKRTLVDKAMQPLKIDMKNVQNSKNISVKSQVTNTDENFQCKVVVEKCPIPINITDPSDIEFKQEGDSTTVTLLKYTSPLDNNTSYSSQINPLNILCPFDINGTCRDKECTFNHCGNKV